MAFKLERVREDKELGFNMHLRSVFTGTAITMGLGVFLVLLGDAIGLSPGNVFSTVGPLRFWSFVYVVAIGAISYYAGGYACAKNAKYSFGTGALHGFTTWGMTNAIAVGIGALASQAVRVVLLGAGSMLVNSLIVVTMGVGVIASLLGGLQAKRRERYKLAEEGLPIVEERETHAA